MIDLRRIIGFEWDAGNARKSVDKHRVTQHEVEQVFLNSPLLLTPDDKHSRSERRFRALGKTDAGQPLTVIFTLRADSTLIRVISARAMHRNERRDYEQET